MSKHYDPPEIRLEIPHGVEFRETREPQRTQVGEAGMHQIELPAMPSFGYMSNAPAYPQPLRDELVTLKRSKVVFDFYVIEDEVWDEDADPQRDKPSRIHGYKMQIAQRLYLPDELKDKAFAVPLMISPYKE